MLAGKKNLSGAFMLKFAKALKLGKEEEEYFVNLVSFNQAYKNKSVDIKWDGKGSGNKFKGNKCDTSQPSGLCH